MVGVCVAFGIRHVLAAIGFGLGAWLILGAGAVLARRWRPSERGLAGAASRVRGTPLAVWGLVFAHAGLGVTTLGVTAMAGWQSNLVVSMVPGSRVTLAGKSVVMTGVSSVDGPNYEASRASFQIETLGGPRTLVSERRLFPASQTTTTQAAINVGVLGNSYISVGDRADDGGIVVRLWNHPLVDCIWGGAFLMAFGGALSLADRRLRVAVVRRAPATSVAQGPASAPAAA
jgi:cytochrome c-type biogenesis protein CcmF